MKIVSAAIKFCMSDEPNYYHILTGCRHCDVFELMFNLGIKYDRETHVQGFLTDDNRFLDRYDAAHVAYENGQTDKLCLPLFSEDMW